MWVRPRKIPDRARGVLGVGSYWGLARSKGFHLRTAEPGDGCTFPAQGDRVLLHYSGALA
eukprot:COSAG01_NODE_11912_length_1836_cov_9.228941_3_plen_59_part_01